MYQYLGSSEEERQKNLALFKQWIGNWNLKQWPEVTKEEIERAVTGAGYVIAG